MQNANMLTAVKKNQANQGSSFTQETPRPAKRVLFYDEERKKHLFPLVRDRDIGVPSRFQNVVHESVRSQRDSSTTMTGPPAARNLPAGWVRPSTISTK